MTSLMLNFLDFFLPPRAKEQLLLLERYQKMEHIDEFDQNLMVRKINFFLKKKIY